MRRALSVCALLAIASAAPLVAQRGQRASGPPPAPRATAPFDLTGYWISVVTEDWRWRMITPAKGDYASVPLNAAAERIVNAWDPARDEAAGEQCRPYGAPAVMRVPGRVHIAWDDDSTLRIETEAGTQTRLFHFASGGRDGGRSWQGESVARWETAGRVGMFGAGPPPRATGLKVVTTQLRPGYLRSNGVPYSANAVVTEYYNVLPKEENGDVWLIITTVVQDPDYLTGRFITSTHFKKLPDGSAWRPTPCR